jgi:uncharacterized membrane protein YfcA
MRLKSKASAGAGTRKLSFKQSNAVLHVCPKQKLSHLDNMRHWLAAVLVGSVVAVAIVAVFVPRADAILNKLLPALMLILAYYFGRRRK